MTEVVMLKGDIWQFDLEDCGIPGRSSAYFLRGDAGWMLIETGAASSLNNVLDAAGIIGIAPADLKYIAVTHIHLDHAGGVGSVARQFPNARIVVHPKGARHIADPSRLMAGATKAWGEEKMKEFGELVPVPGERIMAVTEGQVLDLGGREIEVWDTPGHSKHHMCYLDSRTKGLFSGDAAGVYKPKLSRLLNRPVTRPATPGPEFDAVLMFDTFKRIALSDIRYLYFTHFGVAENPQFIMEILIGQLSVQLEHARKIFHCSDAHARLTEALYRQIKKTLPGWQTTLDLEDEEIRLEWEFMTGLMHLSVAGILDYLKKNEERNEWLPGRSQA